MANSGKSGGPGNWPSKTGNPSGGGRGNNPSTPAGGGSKGGKK